MKLDYSEMIEGYLRTLSPHKRYIDGGNYENISLLDIRANRQMSPCKLYLVAILLHLRKIDELLHLTRIDEYSYYRSIFKNVKAYRDRSTSLWKIRPDIYYVCIVFICYLVHWYIFFKHCTIMKTFKAETTETWDSPSTFLHIQWCLHVI